MNILGIFFFIFWGIYYIIHFFLFTYSYYLENNTNNLERELDEIISLN